MFSGNTEGAINSLLFSILIPILVSILTYFFVSLRDEIKKRKNFSRLGVAIIETLLEEVNTGISIFTAFQNYKVEDKKPIGIPPSASWYGMNTISDEVLLRILAVSKSLDQNDHWHPKKIKIHCKNYFDHMVGSLQNIFESQKNMYGWELIAKRVVESGNYIEAAVGVKSMLTNAMNLLEKNTKSLLPR